ncbi:MAG: hypothetical protein IPH31_15220 [Lewinellaceae bacterium]|nr:hypothetical protein [Lewinellaceae bacterium]
MTLLLACCFLLHDCSNNPAKETSCRRIRRSISGTIRFHRKPRFNYLCIGSAAMQ